MVQLRARKNRTSYAVQFPDISDSDEVLSEENKDDAEGSKPTKSKPPRRRAESDASGSNFSADSAVKQPSEESEDISAGEGEAPDELSDGTRDHFDDDDDDNESLLDVSPSKSGTAELGSRPAGQGGESSKTGALPFRYERTGTLPHLLNKDAVLRPWPLYTPPHPPKVLFREPKLFGETDAHVSRSQSEEGTRDPDLDWSQVISPGPVWELLQDKAWYKDAFHVTTHLTTERAESDAMNIDGDAASFSRSGQAKVTSPRCLRPVVYQSVVIDLHNIELLSSTDAAPYLPSDAESNTDEPTGRPTTCHFGPFGSQTRADIQMFESQSLSDYFEDSKAHVFNAGGPVWGVDWCPIEEGNSKHRACKQYLAAGPFPSKAFKLSIGSRLPRSSKACIQIWSLGPSDPGRLSTNDEGVMRCEVVLCLDCGPAQVLKWCPLPSHDSWSDDGAGEGAAPRKLGILGGVFADGSISFWAVPDPEDMRRIASKTCMVTDAEGGPMFVRLKDPLLRIEMDDAPFWSLDWANSGLIAAGCTNGNIAVYHLRDHFNSRETGSEILPSYYRRVHQSAIRSLAWMKFPPSNGLGELQLDGDPTIICSVGYDGQIILLDTREQTINEMARYRDVINSVVFAPWAGGPIWTDSNVVKWGNISPHEIGRGHSAMQTVGSVWSLSASDYHPFLAVGSADGSCHTTNLYKVTRRKFGGARLSYKIFQMDYNRKTGEYRLLENFLPTHLNPSHRSGQTKAGTKSRKRTSKKNPKNTSEGPASNENENGSGLSSTAGWSPEVSVHCVSWNTGNGLAKGRLLASGTASGLVRVEELKGWIGDAGGGKDEDGDGD